MEKMWSPWRSEYIENIEDKKHDCVFCNKKEYIEEDNLDLVLYRGAFTYVVMNKFPYNNGHLMVVPYIHISNPSQMNLETSTEMWTLLMKSQFALDSAIHPHGYNIGMNVGESGGAGIKDHLHMHIVPRWSGDTNFTVTTSGFKVLSEALEKTKLKLLPFFL